MLTVHSFLKNDLPLRWLKTPPAVPFCMHGPVPAVPCSRARESHSPVKNDEQPEFALPAAASMVENTEHEKCGLGIHCALQGLKVPWDDLHAYKILQRKWPWQLRRRTCKASRN
jgi:hypothetical protein